MADKNEGLSVLFEQQGETIRQLQAANEKLREALEKIIIEYKNSIVAGFTLPKIKNIADQALKEKQV